MLQGAGLDKRYWGEAVMTAIYLKNRSPTSALSGLTPEEKWTGSKPNLSHLHVFGCIAYSLLPEQKRLKLDAKSKMYIFIGYSETSKGYRLSDPHNPKSVIVSRNVAFIENKFYSETSTNNNNYEDFIFYEMINCNNIESNVNSSQNEPSSNNNSLNSSNELNSSSDSQPSSSHTEEFSKNVTLDSSKDVTLAFSDADEHYCTGSEDEAGACSSRIGGASPECVTSPHAAAPTGEATVPASTPVISTDRPVRSTRAKPPLRYRDYDLDFSLMARDSIPSEPMSYEDAMSSPDCHEWKAAMQSEYDSLLANNVWRLVDRPPNENVVKCKWVFKQKHDASGKFDRYKARLVARGFTQKQGIDYSDTFSPVVRHSTMRILFSLANELDLNIDHVDVTTAFLNGELQETIYMEQPPGFNNNDDSKVCHLLKGIYGLKQASRIWNSKVHTLLSENGYVQNKSEPCVYSKREGKNLIIVALYVDDFYIFYSKTNELLPLLESNFSVKNLGSLVSCLGMNVYRDRVKQILKLDQSEYIKKLLNKYGMENCKPVSTPMILNCKLYPR